MSGRDLPSAAEIADGLRSRILAGELRHGDRLPYEQDLANRHGVGPGTVARAMAILRGEGLVVTRAPYGSRVRRPERRTVRVQRGSRVRVWMPSPAERREHGLPEGCAGVGGHGSGRCGDGLPGG